MTLHTSARQVAKGNNLLKYFSEFPVGECYIQRIRDLKLLNIVVSSISSLQQTHKIFKVLQDVKKRGLAVPDISITKQLA